MKHNFLIFGIISFMCMTMMAGCGKKESTDYNAKYEETLKKYYDAIVNYDKDTIDYEGFEGVVEYTMNAGVENALDEIGYAIKDISGDGVPELLIGIIEDETKRIGSQILAVYTCVDGKVQYVFDAWMRNAYFIRKDNSIFNSGSGGAAQAIFGLYQLSKDGTTLECKEYYFSSEKDGNYNDIGFYTNTSGKFDVSISQEIPEREFWSEYDRLNTDFEDMSMTSISTVGN